MTQDQYVAALDVIEKAIGQGVLTIEIDGRRTTWNTIADMIAAANYYRRQIAGATAGQPAPAARERTTFGTFSRD